MEYTDTKLYSQVYLRVFDVYLYYTNVYKLDGLVLNQPRAGMLVAPMPKQASEGLRRKKMVAVS